MVIIGSSFIGMEAALAASKKANVTVIGMDKVPFESILGPQIGDALRKNHEKQGIKFHLSAELSHFEPSSKDPSKVGNVVLKSGEKIPADLVLIGAGVKPVTDYAQNIPGIKIDDKDKSIEVDEHLRVKGIGKDNVYAIGDIAKFPDVKTGDLMRIEHWNGKQVLLQILLVSVRSSTMLTVSVQSPETMVDVSQITSQEKDSHTTRLQSSGLHRALNYDT